MTNFFGGFEADGDNDTSNHKNVVDLRYVDLSLVLS